MKFCNAGRNKYQEKIDAARDKNLGNKQVVQRYNICDCEQEYDLIAHENADQSIVKLRKNKSYEVAVWKHIGNI